MLVHRVKAAGMAGAIALVLSGCSSGDRSLGALAGKLFGTARPQLAASEDVQPENATAGTPPPAQSLNASAPAQRGLFGRGAGPQVTPVRVNKYIWAASLDILGFLPIRSADPFTGVIVTGYGTPPGGGRAYRATIFVQNPALDAGSLKVALHTRSGPVAARTNRAVEDAILARARQLRIAGG